MLVPGWTRALALAGLLGGAGAALAQDSSKYPDWSGQWHRTYGGPPRYDQTKPLRKQEAPLKPEYQARFEASMKDQDRGGLGLDRGYSCLPPGMPRQMSGVSRFELLVSPAVTHILFDRGDYATRRIYTDGRAIPETDQTWFVGYSIGKWLDATGSGRFDTLEVETRRLRSPRTFDQSGMPLADDAEGVIREKIYLDRNDPTVLRDEMTTIDTALTRPWTVMKTYKKQPTVWWYEDNCVETQTYATIAGEVYMLDTEGYLMPMKKNQPPPDLKYFSSPKK